MYTRTLRKFFSSSPLPEELEVDQAGLVVGVLEAGLAAGDDVELVVGQLQRPVDPHRDGHTPLLGLLQQGDRHQY